MNLQLNDKHVLITGGSKGIGLACAEGFLREGARVSLVARNPTGLQQAALALQAIPDARVAVHAADLQNAGAAAAALDAAEAGFGPVDILVNCAGAAKRTAPQDLQPEVWHDAMQAKFFSYIHMIDPVVKRMGERGSGVIINVIGSGGKIARTTHLAGGAANAALMLVSAGLAVAYADKGVRINGINPGPVLTQRMTQRMEVDAKLAASEGRPAPTDPGEGLPLGRVADPEEIANMVLFLASPRASYVTGAIIAMDGAATPTVV